MPDEASVDDWRQLMMMMMLGGCHGTLCMCMCMSEQVFETSVTCTLSPPKGHATRQHEPTVSTVDYIPPGISPRNYPGCVMYAYSYRSFPLIGAL